MSKFEHLKAKRKIAAPLLLLSAVAAGLIYYNFGVETSYIGQAEAVVMTNPAEVSGKIVESHISLGQEVRAGDVIAVIDSGDMRYALEQLELNLKKARVLNAEAQTGQGGRAQSGVAAALAAVSGAEAAASKADQDYQNALVLYQDNAISESALEAAKLSSDTANSGLAAAKAQLGIARNSGAESLSESTNLDILLLESRIAQQVDMIEKCTIRANADGVIISKNYGLGDFVAPGYDIADIASSGEKYLVFYYPKEKISEIRYDGQIPFVYNDSEYIGPVKFIDVKPHYTPQDFQTSANRNRESVKVKILIPESCPIKPGETARVFL